jgi:hypothetical protein
MNYRKKRFQTKIKVQRKAIDVLYEKMIYYNDKAIPLHCRITELLTQTGANPSLIVQLYKKLHELNILVIDCASKLAPYQSAKLQTIEVKSKVEHKFVIAAPMPQKDSQTWLKAAGVPQLSAPQIPKIVDVDFEESNNNNIDINSQ